MGMGRKSKKGFLVHGGAGGPPIPIGKGIRTVRHSPKVILLSVWFPGKFMCTGYLVSYLNRKVLTHCGRCRISFA